MSALAKHSYTDPVDGDCMLMTAEHRQTFLAAAETLVENFAITNILIPLVGLNVLSIDEAQKLQSLSTESKRVDYFLTHLIHKKPDSTYGKLLNILKDNQQKHIAVLLEKERLKIVQKAKLKEQTANKNVDGDCMLMTAEHRQTFLAAAETLVENFDITNILIPLVGLNVLSIKEAQKLQSLSTESKRVDYFLTHLIHKKPDSTYGKLLNILKDNHQEHIAALLEKEHLKIVEEAKLKEQTANKNEPNCGVTTMQCTSVDDATRTCMPHERNWREQMSERPMRQCREDVLYRKMDDNEIDMIRRALPNLSRIDPDNGLRQLLLTTGVFTSQQLERVYIPQHSPYRTVADILELLMSCGRQIDYAKFRYCLMRIGRADLVECFLPPDEYGDWEPGHENPFLQAAHVEQSVGRNTQAASVQKFVKTEYPNENFSSFPDLLFKSVVHVSSGVCKITTGTGALGGGFLFKVLDNNGPLVCGLLTNHHVITKYDIEDNTDCTLEFEGLNRKVQLDFSSGFNTTSWELDATFIELPIALLAKLGKKAKFLEYSTESVEVGMPLFMVHHPGGSGATIGSGFVKDLPSMDVHYTVNTQPGSSGCPVANMKGQIISIHRGLTRSAPPNINFGTKIQSIHDWIKVEFKKWRADLGRRKRRRAEDIYRVITGCTYSFDFEPFL